MAFEKSLNGYSSERGLFSTYLTYGFKNSIRELFKKKDPLNSADSLNEVIGDVDNGKAAERGDIIADETADNFIADIEDKDENECIKRTVRNAVDLLPTGEKEVIYGYFFEKKTYKAIAADKGKNAEYARRLCGKGLKHLRCNRELKRLGNDLGYGSQKLYCNSLNSFNRFGMSSVERVAIDRADIEARKAALQEYERINEKFRAGKLTFAEYEEQTKEAVEFLVYF